MLCVVFTTCSSRPYLVGNTKYPATITGIDAVALHRPRRERSWTATKVFRSNRDESEAALIYRFGEYLCARGQFGDFTLAVENLTEYSLIEERAHACRLELGALETFNTLKSLVRPISLTFAEAEQQILEDNSLYDLIALDMVECLACHQDDELPVHMLKNAIQFLVQATNYDGLSDSISSLLRAFGYNTHEPEHQQLERLKRMLTEANERANRLQRKLNGPKNQSIYLTFQI